MKRLLLAAACVAAVSSHALVEKTIDGKKPIETVLSKTTHNRISVEGGAVEKVFGDHALFAISIDNCTGNAFVNVLKDVDQPVTLTVITTSGLVQDILVTAQEGPSQQIALIESDEQEGVVIQSQASFKPTIEMLNQLLEGKVPFGCGEESIEGLSGLQLPQPLESKIVRSVIGPFEQIRVYQIKNTGKKPVVITPEALKKEEKTWVFLSAHELHEEEQAFCIIGQPKDEI